MRRTTTVVTVCIMALGVGLACGDEAGNAANVTACDNWKKKTDAIKCGEVDFTGYTKNTSCSAFGDIACDFTEYFDCLYTNTKCKEVGTEKTKTEDLSGWPTCYDKALTKCSN